LAGVQYQLMKMDDNNHKSVVNTARKNLDNKQISKNNWLSNRRYHRLLC